MKKTETGKGLTRIAQPAVTDSTEELCVAPVLGLTPVSEFVAVTVTDCKKEARKAAIN